MFNELSESTEQRPHFNLPHIKTMAIRGHDSDSEKGKASIGQE